MKKLLNESFVLIFSIILLCFLLFSSKECILYASRGILIWYQNMIPSLFPFMVLSGFMVRSGLSIKIGRLLQPILGLFFPLSPPMLYAIFMGFLCGFPMGAKIVTDLLEKKEITLEEGEYLLSFCNNIGPLYLLGYVIPLFGYDTWNLIGLMYFVPLLYGFVIGFFLFKKTDKFKLPQKQTHTSYINKFQCFQDSLLSAIEQITILGGCMIFFNFIQILPNTFIQCLEKFSGFYNSDFLRGILCSLTEIGGGLKLLSEFSVSNSTSINNIFIVLSLLTFGGLSCIIQTCFIIKETELKISTYIKHKLIQSSIFIMLFLLNFLK